MKFGRKMAALILAVVMVLMVLGACSEGSASGDVSDNGVEAAQASSTEEGEKTGKNVYFAGPMFNQAEKEYNLKVVKVLEDHGYTVFLPQRDGIEAAALEGKSEEEMTEMIFKLDHDEVYKADIIFMNLDGRAPDEGACVELGMGHAAGKRCYGFKTDTRSIEYGLDINPMITGCMTKLFKNNDGDKMIEELEKYLSENEL